MVVKEADFSSELSEDSDGDNEDIDTFVFRSILM